MRRILLLAVTIAGASAALVVLVLMSRPDRQIAATSGGEIARSSSHDVLPSMIESESKQRIESESKQRDGLVLPVETDVMLLRASSEPWLDPAALQYKTIPLVEIYAYSRGDEMHRPVPGSRDFATVAFLANPPPHYLFDPDAPFLLTPDEVKFVDAKREEYINGGGDVLYHPRDHLLLVAGDDIHDAIRAVRAVFLRRGEITTVRGKHYWLFNYVIDASVATEIKSAIVDGRNIQLTTTEDDRYGSGFYFDEFWWVPLGELEPGDYRVKWLRHDFDPRPEKSSGKHQPRVHEYQRMFRIVNE